MPAHKIDESGVETVETLIASVRSASLTAEAEMFETVYWAWLRLTQAYVNGAPYVECPDEAGVTPYGALSVTNFTLSHWGPQIPGTPRLDNEAVRHEARVDEAWHEREDRRMALGDRNEA